MSPPQGKFLHLLARIKGARSILEIGTLGGYSTLWLARALPADGRLITLEVDPKHAEVARGNFARAGVTSLIEQRLGRAIDTLPRQGSRKPWRMYQNYLRDLQIVRFSRIDDGAMEFTRRGERVSRKAREGRAWKPS